MPEEYVRGKGRHAFSPVFMLAQFMSRLSKKNERSQVRNAVATISIMNRTDTTHDHDV